jgi:D-alanyl-D-alanine carboxypeptidase
LGVDAIDIQTGSGLPLHDPRNDTTISCSAMVRLIRRLDRNLEEKYNMQLEDVVMIAGVDAGATLSDSSKALVVKTGTLNGVKNLAGVAETTEGELYFGIFLEGRNANGGGIQSVLGDLKTNYKLKAVDRQSFAFDPLQPEMQLARVTPSVPTPPAVGVVAVRRN